MKSLLLLVLLLFSLGCGGSVSDSPATGRATFRIAWPEPSRLVPQASQSIEIRVLNGEKVVATKVLARPATEVTIEKLPAKKLVNLVRAFPNADATGIAQAQVRAEVEIKADETVKVSLTMASTIERLEPSPSGELSIEQLNDTLALSATPRNAAGDAVLIKANTLRWTSNLPTVASVTDAGVVTALAAGEVTITATEPESGKSVTFTIVMGPIGRLVYSQIASNIRGTEFAQTGPGTFSKLNMNGVPPLHDYYFYGQIPPPAARVSTRECNIYLSRDVPVGTRVAILGGAVGNPIAEMTIAELEDEHNTQGDLVRYRERAFQAISGHVTLIRVEGLTHTVRVENVKMRAYDRVYGGDDLGTPVSVEGAGTFVVNGTVTFKEQPN